MSINYYCVNEANLAAGKLHVGLSAAGAFMFEAHPELGLTSYQDWLAKLQQPGNVLINEYNDQVILDVFIGCVQRKLKEAVSNPRASVYHNAPELPEGEKYRPGKRYRDAEGHLFFDYEFE